MASLAGLGPAQLFTPYAMTKHAVVGLSTSLRIEVVACGVHVNVLCPAIPGRGRDPDPGLREPPRSAGGPVGSERATPARGPRRPALPGRRARVRGARCGGRRRARHRAPLARTLPLAPRQDVPGARREGRPRRDRQRASDATVSVRAPAHVRAPRLRRERPRRAEKFHREARRRGGRR
ncbi:SDR family NAD(P)-dependent oxidoreductase [Sorangium sp. So ce204]